MSLPLRFRTALAALAIGFVPAAAEAQAGTQTTAQTTAAADSTRPAAPARSSWVSDRRNFVVGDIITVLIDDYTISTAIKENIAQDDRTRGLGVSVRVPNTSQNANIDASNRANQQQRGQARRENRFQNEMSVRVVSVGQNGLLQVQGTKLIDIDRAKQDIVFTGWVRAQDISSGNLVESSRVADAQLTYQSPGPLGKPKQGLLTRVISVVWP
jgi:flagellar L-ring protein FlgH